MELKRHCTGDLEDGKEEAILPVHNKQYKQIMVSERGQCDSK